MASQLEVRMFSVGKGEGDPVVFPAGRAWLIDGGTTNRLGPNAQVGQLVRYLEDHGLVLACVPSHRHVDHAGAVAAILMSGSWALAPPPWTSITSALD